jgi:hypothetical protein
VREFLSWLWGAVDTCLMYSAMMLLAVGAMFHSPETVKLWSSNPIYSQTSIRGAFVIVGFLAAINLIIVTMKAIKRGSAARGNEI